MSTAMDKKKAREAERALRKEQDKIERAEKEAKKQAEMHTHFDEKLSASKAAGTKILKLKEWMSKIPYESTDESLKYKTYFEVVKAMAAVDSKEYAGIGTDFDVNECATLLKYVSKAMERSKAGSDTSNTV